MKNKRFMFIFLFAVLASFFSFSAIISLYGESDQQLPALQRLVFNNSIPYLYFNSPIASDVSAEGYLISTYDNNITVLNKNLTVVNEIKTDAPASDIAYFNDTVISLQEGKIVLNKPDSKKFLSGSYESFIIERTIFSLFAIGNGELFEFDLVNLLNSPFSTIDELNYIRNRVALPAALQKNVSAFTSDSEKVYFAVSNLNNKNYDDIFYLNKDRTVFERMYERTDKVRSIAIILGNLFTLSNGEVTKFNIFDGRLSKEISIYMGATTLNAYNSNLYILTETNAMIYCDAALSNTATLFMSQSSIEGFFSSPASVYTRKGNLFVADTLNGRLFISGSKGQKTINDFERINSVVSDNLGNIYVSYNINKIAKLDKNFKVVETFSLARAIKKLLIDLNNNIYIIAGSDFYVLTSANEMRKLNNFPSIVDACFVMGSKVLIIYDGARFYKNLSPLDAGSPNNELFSYNGIVSFVADVAGNVFFFTTNGNLYRYDGATQEINQIILVSDNLDLKYATSVYISNVENNYITYGDLIFADSGRHCIYKLEKSAANVIIIDINHTVPKIDEENAILSAKPLVYKLNESAEVYSSPIEMSGGPVLPNGSRIFYYDAYNTLEEYAFVIYEDIIAQKLIYGYIFRSLINFTSYGYSLPPTNEAVVFFSNTPIFKWPSKHSAILEYYDKERIVKLNDFSAPLPDNIDYSQGTYIDGYGKIWYRVYIDENHDGFIQADNLSINHYVPQSRPKTNAQIKEFGGVKYASIYSYDSEKDRYILLENEFPLPVGTRIELIQIPLDAQKEYTEIKFYREELGTLTCYIKTGHIKYDTVNTVQIVAIISLVVVITSVIVLVIYFANHKYKKNMQ